MEEDLDYDAAEMFEDDEENPILEGDEEANKAIEERVRREMRGARNFESKEDEMEEDVDLDDLFEAKKVTKEGKRTKRYLKKLEGKGDYDTDDEEENPYASEVEPPILLLIFRRKKQIQRQNPCQNVPKKRKRKRKRKKKKKKKKKKKNLKFQVQQEQNPLPHPQQQTSQNNKDQHQHQASPRHPKRNPRKIKNEQGRQLLNLVVDQGKRIVAGCLHQLKGALHLVDRVLNLPILDNRLLLLPLMDLVLGRLWLELLLVLVPLHL